MNARSPTQLNAVPDEQRSFGDNDWMYQLRHKHVLALALASRCRYTDISDPFYFQNAQLLTGSAAEHLRQPARPAPYAATTWRFLAAVHSYELAVYTSELRPYSRLPAAEAGWWQIAVGCDAVLEIQFQQPVTDTLIAI